ncbi:hypothetical protein QWY85_21025 [Neolewinella lacunae]|uniref:Uncharacterized protein n=1 Tax=Neolewinella lacunae TaxID=1517758 RepID=A0A923PR28_9BACT|nr:hypothetical protein [Neolewinella lacunae]MBC6996211.1 hypothetical protein [Neolewinella lacunae]MDN3637168.1 hypothetical protein [Neolewinella lacunae]
MPTLTLEIIDPRVIPLLENLAKLDLIRIKEEEAPFTRFAALLAKLRSQEDNAPSEAKILLEVKKVRNQR